jgi:hypothetical protein
LELRTGLFACGVVARDAIFELTKRLQRKSLLKCGLRTIRP